MNAPSEQDRMIKLWKLVQNDPRLEHIAVDLRPATFTIEIGGKYPFWKKVVDQKRLISDDLRAYAKEIVDEWEAQLSTA